MGPGGRPPVGHGPAPLVTQSPEERSIMLAGLLNHGQSYKGALSDDLAPTNICSRPGLHVTTLVITADKMNSTAYLPN